MDSETGHPRTARDIILARIHAALATSVGHTPEPAVPRAHRQADNTPRAAIVAQFISRVGEYNATVRETTAAELPQASAAALSRRRVRRLVVPADLPDAWLPGDVELLRDAPPLTNEALDTSDGVLTACALGIAQTGTIILDAGPGQGRRALSLIPDYHLCVVLVEQIVGIVPEAIAALGSRSSRPLTFISGPSATSDIELSRVEGVHGPRTLEILVVHQDDAPRVLDAIDRPAQ